MSGVVELEDFEEDLKNINEKLEILNYEIEQDENLKNRKKYSLSNIMIQRDINRIFMLNDKNIDWFLNEWDIKSKEEKQEFIARYVESITFKKDPEHRHVSKNKTCRMCLFIRKEELI